MIDSTELYGWTKFPAWQHVFPVAKVGNVFPKSGVAAKVQDGFKLSDAGEFARIHENGDMFLCDGEKWLRVDADTVDFVERRKF